MPNKFFNLTELDDSEAIQVLEQARDIFLQGEYDRLERLEKYEDNKRIFNNEIWSEADIEQFFGPLDLTPYKFAIHRPLINNLISRQRNRRFTFDIVPTDTQSYERDRQGRQEFVMKHGNEFDTIEEAEKYYDEYADDEYAKAVSATLHNSRYECKAKYVESEVFQEGLVTGLDFFKSIYSTMFNREGGIEITRRPQHAMIYDESSVRYDLHDIEYIGEVHRLYKTDLILQWPEAAEEIEEYFDYYTNLDKRSFNNNVKETKEFYKYTHGENFNSDPRLKVAELWYLDAEERLKVYDSEQGEEKVAEFGADEPAVMDALKSKVLLELQQQAEENPEMEEVLMSDDIENEIMQIVNTRFEISTTHEPIWYKLVFSYNALFEYERSPLPHGSHPYTAFFAQFSEGTYRSMIEDIADVILAINKALAFRELMLAHGSKNLVVVDETQIERSGYSLDDIADHWTRIGGVIGLKLKPGRRIQDVFQSVTTVGQGIDAINNVLNDLDNRLFQISGVNLAQLGVTERETSGVVYSKQLSEGEANNGLIFDNFVRSLEAFYNDKVVPLVVEYMKLKRKTVIRMLGEHRSPWIKIDFDERFEIFEQAVRAGEYNTVLIPKEDNPRIGAERAARYLQMAMAGILHPEVALEFSDDPDRYKIIKRNKEKMREAAHDQAAQMVEFGMIQEIMANQGVNQEKAQEILDELQKARSRQMAQEKAQPSGQQEQFRQGGGGGFNIQAQGAESQRMNAIENQSEL